MEAGAGWGAAWEPGGKGGVRVEWEESACICDSQPAAPQGLAGGGWTEAADLDSIQEWEPSCGGRRELPV